jgi:hypothetical protein
MIKKGLFVIVLVIFVAVSAFAEVDIGIGGNFVANFDSYKYDGVDNGLHRTLSGGFFVLFDATYIEVNAGMLFGRIKQEYGNGEYSDETLKLTYLTFGLFGKYPIPIYFRGVYLSPMLGVQYDLGLSAEFVLVGGEWNTYAKYQRDDILWDTSDRFDYMNRLWIKFGIGFDIPFLSSFSLSTSFLYGINFGTKDDKKYKDNGNFVDSFHQGLDIRLAILFKE